MYRPLYHDQLLFSPADHQDVPLSDDNFLAFANANMPDSSNDWWIWERTPMAAGIGRFSGCPDGLLEFKKLAESAAILFDEMELYIPEKGYYGWLNLLHNIAWWHQLPLLRCKTHPPLSTDIVLEELETLAERWHSFPDDDAEYPRHLYTFFLIQSVFTSSMTLIEAVLDPESVVFTSSATSSNLDVLLGPAEFVPDEATTAPSPELGLNIPPDRNVFKKVADKTWVIQFVEAGIEPEGGLINEQVGFYHIQKLLSSEKQPVSYVDLYAAIPVRGNELLAPHESRSVTREDEYSEESQGRHSSGGTGSNERATQETITKVSKHKTELLAKIEQAKLDDDEVVLGKLQSDLMSVQKYLNCVSNRWGYPRQFELGTPASKARNCVKKNISVAMASLNKFEKLSAFLKVSLQPQGAQGREYIKAGKVKWETT